MKVRNGNLVAESARMESWDTFLGALSDQKWAAEIRNANHARIAAAKKRLSTAQTAEQAAETTPEAIAHR